MILSFPGRMAMIEVTYVRGAILCTMVANVDFHMIIKKQQGLLLSLDGTEKG